MAVLGLAFVLRVSGICIFRPRESIGLADAQHLTQAAHLVAGQVSLPAIFPELLQSTYRVESFGHEAVPARERVERRQRRHRAVGTYLPVRADLAVEHRDVGAGDRCDLL